MGARYRQESRVSRVVILAVTRRARALAERIAKEIPEAQIVPRGETVAEVVSRTWDHTDALIFVMAAGIAVRSIAPHLQDKRSDPAVVVVSQDGRFVVPLLSGHLGGANDLAEFLARVLGARAVITTASDLTGATALDLWMEDIGLRTEAGVSLAGVMRRLADGERLRLAAMEVEPPPLPGDIVAEERVNHADLLVTIRERGWFEESPLGQDLDGSSKPLLLYPRAVAVGVGCNRGTPAETVEEAVRLALRQAGISELAVAFFATVDIKEDEPGIAALADVFGVPVLYYPAERLDAVASVTHSDVVRRATGTGAVCEPAAILAAGNGKLILEKRSLWRSVTVAAALDVSSWWERGQGLTNS